MELASDIVFDNLPVMDSSDCIVVNFLVLFFVVIVTYLHLVSSSATDVHLLVDSSGVIVVNLTVEYS